MSARPPVRKRKEYLWQAGRPSPPVGKQVNFEPDSAFRKEKETARPKKEKKRKTVGENTENRRRDESQARGKEEDRRVIDLPSP